MNKEATGREESPLITDMRNEELKYFAIREIVAIKEQQHQIDELRAHLNTGQ